MVGGKACKEKTKRKFWGYLFSNCICLCGGLTLGSSKAPTQPLAPPCLLRNGEKIEGRQKGKSIKLVMVQKGRQNLCVQAKQSREFIHYFPSAGRSPAASGKQGLRMFNTCLGKKTPSPQMFLLASPFPELFFFLEKALCPP